MSYAKFVPNPKLSISPKILDKTTAAIRLDGLWHKISQKQFIRKNFSGEEAINNEIKSLLNLMSLPGDNKEQIKINESYKNALDLDFKFNENYILQVAQTLIQSKGLRKNKKDFITSTSPELNCFAFKTVSPFLIEKRLSELINWTRESVNQKNTHPLIAIAVFYLLFLQTSPFNTKNQIICSIITRNLLAATNHSFIHYTSIIPCFKNNLETYTSSLKEAEKTAYTTWSSLNVWITFFLNSIIHSTEKLIAEAKKIEKNSKLSNTQEKIFDAIDQNGIVGRNKIAKLTGINIATIKYNLQILTRDGYLIREGAGRGTKYKTS